MARSVSRVILARWGLRVRLGRLDPMGSSDRLVSGVRVASRDRLVRPAHRVSLARRGRVETSPSSPAVVVVLVVVSRVRPDRPGRWGLLVQVRLVPVRSEPRVRPARLGPMARPGRLG